MKRAALIFLIMSFGWLCLSSTTLADTFVKGVIEENTTWTAADSPFVIVDNVTIAAGATLTVESGVEITSLEKEFQSHETHFDAGGKGPAGITDCSDCHDNPIIKDGACDECHSPDGAFNGVDDASIGAFANWPDGVYTLNGELKAGKEDWCLGCHDDNPNTAMTNESSFIEGVYAPNIAGDENITDTYGYNITGHKVVCTECHVAGKDHIDGLHRTYEVADDGEVTQTVVNPYNDSYRLKDGSLRVPAPAAPGIEISDYALCFECHNPDEVLGAGVDDADVSHTNFWDSAPQSASIGNAHTYHLQVSGLRGDTDWDGVVDARETCISCHTIHGSVTQMIRHGELISTPGTTDRVPALDFSYVVPPAVFSTATWTSPALDADTYDVKVHIPTDLYNNHAGDAHYTVSHDGGADVEETVDQQIDGGVWVSLGTNFTYNQGSTGTVVLDNDFSIGQWLLADAVRWVGTTTYQVDNDAAVFSPSADWLTWDTDPADWDYIGSDFRYIGRELPIADPLATLVTSSGGWTQYGSGAISSNYVCRACHNEGPALYQRTPKLWPKVLTTPGPVPETVSNDGTDSSTITVTISDPDNNVDTVVIDLSPLGGLESMTDNSDGTYSYTLAISNGTTDTEYDFPITATDDDGNMGTGEVTLNIIDPTAVYVDNTEAIVSPDCSPPCDPFTEWAFFTTDQAYKEDFRYKVRDASGDNTVMWMPTLPETRDYEVYAWWDDGAGFSAPLAIRSKNVPYAIEVSTDGGMTWSVLDSFTVDQTIEGPGGGQWNQLGTTSYSLSAGTTTRVVLSDDATLAPWAGSTTYVIGDAVKFVPVP